MSEKRFAVVERESATPLAERMNLGMTLMFIEAYIEKYHGEIINLAIVEEEYGNV